MLELELEGCKETNLSTKKANTLTTYKWWTEHHLSRAVEVLAQTCKFKELEKIIEVEAEGTRI